MNGLIVFVASVSLATLKQRQYDIVNFTFNILNYVVLCIAYYYRNQCEGENKKKLHKLASYIWEFDQTILKFIRSCLLFIAIDCLSRAFCTVSYYTSSFFTPANICITISFDSYIVNLFIIVLLAC